MPRGSDIASSYIPNPSNEPYLRTNQARRLQLEGSPTLSPWGVGRLEKWPWPGRFPEVHRAVVTPWPAN